MRATQNHLASNWITAQRVSVARRAAPEADNVSARGGRPAACARLFARALTAPGAQLVEDAIPAHPAADRVVGLDVVHHAALCDGQANEVCGGGGRRRVGGHARRRRTRRLRRCARRERWSHRRTGTALLVLPRGTMDVGLCLGEFFFLLSRAVATALNSVECPSDGAAPGWRRRATLRRFPSRGGCSSSFQPSTSASSS